ncbi:MAG: hypothetical protein KGI05_09140 [Thaumarchaeota archaeon]|nr:hypothetical protein [Nitrososphaerota archaeon]
MEKQTFTAMVEGKETQITIDVDPSWGKVQALTQSILVPDGRGGQRIDMNMFYNKVLELAVTDGLDVTNKAKMLQLSAKEMTFILGEIISRLPLEKYSQNLKIDNLIPQL